MFKRMSAETQSLLGLAAGGAAGWGFVTITGLPELFGFIGVAIGVAAPLFFKETKRPHAVPVWATADVKERICSAMEAAERAGVEDADLWFAAKQLQDAGEIALSRMDLGPALATADVELGDQAATVLSELSHKATYEFTARGPVRVLEAAMADEEAQERKLELDLAEFHSTKMRELSF